MKPTHVGSSKPELGKVVILYGLGGMPAFGIRNGNTTYTNRDTGDRVFGVTHWMEYQRLKL